MKTAIRGLLATLLAGTMLLVGCSSNDSDIEACTTWLTTQNALMEVPNSATPERELFMVEKMVSTLETATDTATGADVKHAMGLLHDAYSNLKSQGSQPIQPAAEAVMTACKQAGADMSYDR